MLRFSVNARRSGTLQEIQTGKQLDIERKRLKALVNKIDETDSKLELSREYMDSLRRSQRRKEDSAKDGTSFMSRGVGDIDEDIMDDLH